MNRMYEVPFQEAKDYCGKCKKLENAIKKLEADDLDQETLGAVNPRNALPKLPKGKGKSCTLEKGIQEKIRERRRAGDSQRKIAEDFGISRSRVQRIVSK